MKRNDSWKQSSPQSVSNGGSGITFVIPCLDEEPAIAEVIKAAREGAKKLNLDAEIIVVDNGSTDRSAEIAREHGARVLEEPRTGYGSALRRGFNSASHEVVVMGDADLTYDFREISDLVEPILEDKADFAIGNRMKNIQPGAMPFMNRYVGNPILSLALRVMFHGNRTKDAHCGLRAIRRSSYAKLNCVTTGMEFASEMVVRAIDSKLRVVERNINYYPRLGDSKLHPFPDGWRHLRFMMLHSPTWMLLIPGAIGWFLGLAISIPMAFGPLEIKGRVFDIHCMMTGGLLNIISIQVITIGLLSKAYAHLSGLRPDPIVRWFYRWFTFERALLLAAPLILVGLFVVLRIVYVWTTSGFGELSQAKPFFLGIMCLINGAQIWSSCFLFSIMAMPRRYDSLPQGPIERGSPASNSNGT